MALSISLKTGVQRGGGSGAPAPSFDPATLFAGGEDGTWLEQAATFSFTSTTTLTNPTATNTAGFWLSRDGGAGYSGGNFSGLDADIVDTANTAAAWVTYGSNPITTGADGSVEMTYVDNGNGGLIYLTGAAGLSRDIVLNTEFVLLSFEAKKNGGSAQFATDAFEPEVPNTNLTTEYQTYQYVVTRDRNFPFLIFRNMGAGDVVNVRNIKVEPIPGNHAFQNTAAARPTLQTGTPAFLRDDTVDDALNWNAPADTDYTIARLNSAGTVTIATGQSLSGATDIFLEQDIAAYLAVNRALTGPETTGLTAYLEALS